MRCQGYADDGRVAIFEGQSFWGKVPEARDFRVRMTHGIVVNGPLESSQKSHAGKK